MGAGFHGGFGGTHGNKEKHKDYIENTLSKSSPIKIPSSAIIIEEQKNGYEQVNILGKKTITLIQVVGILEHRTLRKSKATVGLFSVIKRVLDMEKTLVLLNTRYLLEKTNGCQRKNGRQLYEQEKMALQQKSKRRC